MDPTESMTPPPAPTKRNPLPALLLIGCVLGMLAGAFAYTAGWLSPERLTPDRLVASLAPPGGAALGHRRNHTKGICFTGVLAMDGAGTALSSAAVFETGEYPVIGRFNVGSPDLYVKDANARVRGMGLQITGPNQSLWRMALIDLPFFPVATPQAFYELQIASTSKAPDAMQHFTAAHPEFGAFLAWLPTAPWTVSYAEERFNSIDSFVFTSGSRVSSVVRWSLLPETTPNSVTKDDLAKRDANFLESDIARRVREGPVSWNLVVYPATPGELEADPSKAWSEGYAVKIGKLVVVAVEPEPDGPCREINFDPTVLPHGITTSRDPFPAARASAYRRSYDLRTAEARYYPHTPSDGSP